MKTAYRRSIIQRSLIEPTHLAYPSIPTWISSMGLEWLYELLWKSSYVWKQRLAQGK